VRISHLRLLFLVSGSLALAVLLRTGAIPAAQQLFGASDDRYGATQPRGAPTLVPDRVVLTISEDPARSLAVSWRTTTAARRGYVEIARAAADPRSTRSAIRHSATTRQFVADNGPVHYHSAVISGLEPGTLYAYRVGDGNRIWSEWFHTRTAPNGAAPLAFLYFGDAQNDVGSMWAGVVRRAFAALPDAAFMLHAGDLVDRPWDAQWAEWFAATGWIAATIPTIPAAGNHEYYPRDGAGGRVTAEGRRVLAQAWDHQFNLPQNGPDSLRNSVFYSDIQDVRVIVLNSQELLQDRALRAAQLDWLERVLADNPTRWTIVALHHPVHSTARGRDNTDLRTSLEPILSRFRVDLVLQGHDHSYARGDGRRVSPAPDARDAPREVGPMYVVSVSGPKMYDLDDDVDWYDTAAQHVQLFQIVRIDGDTLTFEAHTVAGQIHDAFTLVKRPGLRNILLDPATALRVH
jgi:hypothetical protein